MNTKKKVYSTHASKYLDLIKVGGKVDCSDDVELHVLGDVWLPNGIKTLPGVKTKFYGSFYAQDSDLEKFDGEVCGDFNISGSEHFKTISKESRFNSSVFLKGTAVEKIDNYMGGDLDLDNTSNLSEIGENTTVMGDVSISNSSLRDFRCKYVSGSVKMYNTKVTELDNSVRISGKLDIKKQGIKSINCFTGIGLICEDCNKLEEIGESFIGTDSVAFFNCSLKRFAGRASEVIVKDNNDKLTFTESSQVWRSLQLDTKKLLRLRGEIGDLYINDATNIAVEDLGNSDIKGSIFYNNTRVNFNDDKSAQHLLDCLEKDELLPRDLIPFLIEDLGGVKVVDNGNEELRKEWEEYKSYNLNTTHGKQKVSVSINNKTYEDILNKKDIILFNKDMVLKVTGDVIINKDVSDLPRVETKFMGDFICMSVNLKYFDSYVDGNAVLDNCKSLELGPNAIFMGNCDLNGSGLKWFNNWCAGELNVLDCFNLKEIGEDAIVATNLWASGSGLQSLKGFVGENVHIANSNFEEFEPGTVIYGDLVINSSRVRELNLAILGSLTASNVSALVRVGKDFKGYSSTRIDSSNLKYIDGYINILKIDDNKEPIMITELSEINYLMLSGKSKGYIGGNVQELSLEEENLENFKYKQLKNGSIDYLNVVDDGKCDLSLSPNISKCCLNSTAKDFMDERTELSDEIILDWNSGKEFSRAIRKHIAIDL